MTGVSRFPGTLGGSLVLWGRWRVLACATGIPSPLGMERGVVTVGLGGLHGRCRRGVTTQWPSRLAACSTLRPCGEWMAAGSRGTNRPTGLWELVEVGSILLARWGLQSSGTAGVVA